MTIEEWNQIVFSSLFTIVFENRLKMLQIFFYILEKFLT